MELTSKQRAQLRGLANTIDTIIHIGKDGIGENLVKPSSATTATSTTANTMATASSHFCPFVSRLGFFAFFCLDSFCSKRFPTFSAIGLSLSFQPVARLHCSVVDGISHFRHLVDGHFQSHQHPSIQILIHTCP